MEARTIPDTLRELVQREPHSRSKMDRLRAALPDIEAAQSAGVPHDRIIAALNAEHGLGLTRGTFKVMMHRLRKEAGKRDQA